MNKREFYSKGYYAGLVAEPRFSKIIEIAHKLNEKADRLLDVGCGGGAFTVLLKQAINAKEVFGIDIAEEAVTVAQGRGIKAIQVDIDERPLPFDDAYFDVVYCGEIIEHLFNPDHLLEEVHRVLKPKGTALISTPNLAGWPNGIALLFGYQPYPTAVSPKYESVGKLLIKGTEGQWGHIRVFTAKAFKELLRLHHFEIKRLVGCPVLINSPLPPVLSTIITGVDKVMSKFPSLSTRLIAIVEKYET
jgi:methionine biosynthesis protein MetW